MIDLSGKVALVTGGARGIGRACGLQLAACGADVAVNFLNSRDAAAETVRDIQALGRRALALRGDVSLKDDVQAAVDVVLERFGRLDIIVSNAAAGGFRKLMDVSPANWDSVQRSNAAPLLWLTQAAAGPLQAASPGKVIAISSHGSQRGFGNYGAIGPSKAALESLARHLAFELGPSGINFNVVLSGMVATDAVKSMPGAESTLRAAQDVMLVQRRDLRSSDVAEAVAFLASRSADMIQGQTLIVDGGICIRI